MHPITTIIISTDANDAFDLDPHARELGLRHGAFETGVGAELEARWHHTLVELAATAATAAGYNAIRHDDTAYSLTYLDAVNRHNAVDLNDTPLDLDALTSLAASAIAAWWTGPHSPNGALYADDGILIGPATRAQRDASLAAGYTGLIVIDDTGRKGFVA